MKNKNLYILLIASLVAVSTLDAEAKMTKEAHALYQQACSYEYKSDYNTAIKIIQKAIAMNGDDAMLYTKIAGLYSDTGNYEEALGAYKKAIKLRPNDAFIYISIGNILQTMGDYENAYNSYMQAQQIYPEYKYNYLNLANIEYYRKNYKSAIENYNTFLSAYPEHQEASENLANVYYASNQPDKACEIFSNIYKKYPTAFKDYANYGMALFDTKQFQPASEMLSKALEENCLQIRELHGFQGRKRGDFLPQKQTVPPTGSKLQMTRGLPIASDRPAQCLPVDPDCGCTACRWHCSNARPHPGWLSLGLSRRGRTSRPRVHGRPARPQRGTCQSN